MIIFFLAPRSVFIVSKINKSEGENRKCLAKVCFIKLSDPGDPRYSFNMEKLLSWNYIYIIHTHI